MDLCSRIVLANSELVVSLHIYLLTLTDDEELKFDRAIVERAFKGVALNQVGDYWSMGVGYGSISVDDEPKIRGISVRSPPSYAYLPEFWNAMFEILCQTRTVLLWPAGGPKPHCCLANPDMIPEVPADFIESFGEPEFVSSGTEIDALMQRSFS